MKKTKKHLGTQGIRAKNQSIMVGNVVIPFDVDRSVYLSNCYRNYTIMVKSTNDSYYRNVGVDEDCLQRIIFPKKPEEVGSLVVCVNIPKHNRYFVLGVMFVKNNVTNYLNELQYRIQKLDEDGYADLNMDAKAKRMSFNVVSEVDDKGEINMFVSNPNDTAKINVIVNGAIDIYAKKHLKVRTNEELDLIVEDEEENVLYNLRYERGVGFTMVDEFDNTILTDGDKIQVYNEAGQKTFEMNKDGISLGSSGTSAEKAALAETLKKDIEELIDDIIALVIPTIGGPTTISPGDVIKLNTLKGKLNNFLSDVVTLD